jgi:catechol 2,3-dioxygenase-like lactoylglutathione lyase family enzyme
VAAIDDPARCIPVLTSLNIEETRAFYSDWLGFSGEAYGDYLLMKRDEMEIHFRLTTNSTPAEHTGCYIRGGQVPALYEEFRARGVPRLSDFAVRPWNMKEFYIRDPDGNLLNFACAPEEVC